MPDGRQLPQDAGDAMTWAETARGIWRDRDARMDQDEGAWALEQPALEPGEESFQLAAAATQVNKPTRMMSGVDLLLEVAPETEDSRPASQRIEDFGRWAWDEVCIRHASATGHQLLRSICHYINLRGWLTYTLMLNPADPSFPFTFQLLDPRQVYPDTLYGAPACITHRYRASVRELLYAWPTRWVTDALNLGDPAEAVLDTTPVDCIGFYTPYETAFLVNGDWLKPPTAHEYGFNPLVRVYREGSPAGTQDQRGGLSQPSRLIGTGTLTSLLPTLRDMQKVAIMAATVLANTADPWRVFRTMTGQAPEVLDEEAKTVTIRADESYEQIFPPPVATQEAQALLTLGNDSVSREGIGPALFGLQGGLSGFQDKVNAGSATDALTPAMECLRLGLQLFFRHLFKQFVIYGLLVPNQSVQYVAVDRTSGLRTAQNRLSPLDVLGADARVVVHLSDVAPRDQAALMNTAALAVREGLYDVEGAHRDILRSENPTASAQAALHGVLERDPQYQMMMALLHTLQTSTDPNEIKVCQVMWQAVQQKLAAQSAPPGPAGGGGGQPPLPGSGGLPGGTAPPPGLGVPTTTMPPALGVAAGLPPNGAVLGPQVPGAGFQPV